LDAYFSLKDLQKDKVMLFSEIRVAFTDEEIEENDSNSTQKSDDQYVLIMFGQMLFIILILKN
jgi:hypothetical protein